MQDRMCDVVYKCASLSPHDYKFTNVSKIKTLAVLKKHPHILTINPEMDPFYTNKNTKHDTTDRVTRKKGLLFLN